MILVALIWLIVTVLLCVDWYEKDGILFFLDLNRIGMIIWCFGTGLYDLGLSDLYHPDFLINAISFVVVCIFWVFESISQADVVVLRRLFSELKLPNNVFYWIALALIAFASFAAFKVNADAGMLRGLSDNPGMVVEFQGGYLYRLTVPVAIVFYFAGRLAKQKLLKVMSFALFATFFYFTACDLSRGPILWILTGCLLFELLNYVHKTGKIKITGKTFLLLCASFFAIIFAFDSFGSIRTASLFSSVSSQYQMNVDVPDGITWIYIYISSPLENARHAVENLTVTTPTIGCCLFYPFIKLGANLFGLDSGFVAWLESSKTVYSYMATDPGLTVGSFLIDAYQDFSFLGIAVYPAFYGLVSIVVKKMLSWKKLSSLTKLVIFALAIQEPLWSIFDNTVFSGPLWVCAFAMIAIDLFTTFMTNDTRIEVGDSSHNGMYLEERMQ